MTFKKQVGPKGTVITMVWGKAGSRKVCSGRIKAMVLIDLLGDKGSREVDFLEIPEIENGTKLDQWRQDRHQETFFFS